MRKTNNKFRNNNNNSSYNQIYSLNYKFDSTSPAGKVSGTALDLIKRYNELAKEAHMNNDYVGAEVFRQYAEHYRKIVTEINERKNQRQREAEPAQISNDNADTQAEDTAQPAPLQEAEVAAPQTAEAAPTVEKKAFKIVEISAEQANTLPTTEPAAKPRRQIRKKSVAV